MIKEVRIVEKGWIKVHRSITECFIWTDKPFDKARAWIDLLLLVCHKDKKIMIDGKPFTVARGSYLISRGKLADRWGWSLKKLDNYLRVLEREEMVTTFSTKKGIVITIVNYDKFQVKGTTEDTAEDTTQDTVEDIPEEIVEDTAEDRQKKELNNVMNVNNISSSLHSVVDAWNSLSEYGIKPISKLTSGTKRYDSLVARLKKYGLDNVLKAIENIKHSDFLQGNTGDWFITFDWFVKPNNFPKVLEGNYNNTNPKPQQTTTSNELDPQITAQLRALEEQQLASMPDVANMSDEDIDRLIRGEL